MKAAIRTIALVLLMASPMAMAGSWWNGDWKFRKEISFDLSPTGADVAGSPSDIPVLVRLSIGNFSYFGDTKPDGADFRVLSGDDKTPLKFHFERYDPQTQMAFLWIQVPKMTGGGKADKAYVYYGNPDAVPAGDAGGTYDADQALVLHFGGEGLPQDSTAYKNNATASTAESVAASFAGAGAHFSGTQSLKVPASASLQLTAAKGYTATVWVKFDQPQKDAVVLSLGDATRELVLGVDGVRPAAHLGAVAVTGAADLEQGGWHQLAATVAAGQLTLYVDGSPAGSAAVPAADINATLTVGTAAAGGRGFVGELDEVGVAHIARSADWIRALARGQGPDASLVVYGADGQKEGGQSSYFVTIAKNLTVDGWVIIVICLMMLAIAIVIMVMKAQLLSRTERANDRFLEAYRTLGDDVTALAGMQDAAATHQRSTLYHIYATGTEELFKRVLHRRPAPGESVVLSSQSIEAIRASMDATQVRAQQRLSARMVLLTIAISGGPFLGLLGTVIGVMITFAAIALSGDVNINAIAPGTAAALAATVAGLAVAIPCLFGYNWLNTRIKGITIENRVFLDEFVARLAEQYA
jgi:biopolymer transport protein ExbB